MQQQLHNVNIFTLTVKENRCYWLSLSGLITIQLQATVVFSSCCWGLSWKGDVCDHSEKEIKIRKTNSAANTVLACKHSHFLAVPQIRSVAQISRCSNQPTSQQTELWVHSFAKNLPTSRFSTLGTWHTLLCMNFLVFCFSKFSNKACVASTCNNFVLFLGLTSIFCFHWDIFFPSLFVFLFLWVVQIWLLIMMNT